MRKPLLSAACYRQLLTENVIPFWRRHALDEEHGGIFTCMTEEGELLSTDKYLWSQGRAIWVFAALFNRIEANPDHLLIARRTAEFVLAHGRDEEGAFLFRVSREGIPLEPATSAFVDYFVAYGLTELFRATGESRYAEEALAIFRRAARVTQDPLFDRFAPYARPPGVHFSHAPVMLGLEVAQELGEITAEPDVRDFSAWCLMRIMEEHAKPLFPLLLEHLDGEAGFLNTPEGRVIVPGHAIESMWFVLHYACRRQDAALARRTLAVLRCHLECGWDATCGGLFLGIDACGQTPWWPHAEKKLWWPHTEALYALLLAHRLVGESWTLEWLERIWDWSVNAFSMPECGEWRQRLSREGIPLKEVIALPVKDPFHLPRALILATTLLEGSMSLPVDALAAQLRSPTPRD